MEIDDPELRTYLDQLETIRHDADHLLDGLEPQQANWRAKAGDWSVAQCIEHLTLTLRLYPQRVEHAFGEARRRKAAGARPYREGPFSRWFVRSMEPPPRMRIGTRRTVVPPTDLDGDDVLSAFEAELTRFGELMAAADGVPLRHGKVQSPFSKLFRFTIAQTFQINLAHLRRHVWQARQVQRQPGYPRVVTGRP